MRYFAFLFGLLAATAAHAQNWSSYDLGRNTYTQGTDAQGGQWNGTSYELGGNRYTDITGSNGQTKHCTSYRLGHQTYTDCH